MNICSILTKMTMKSKHDNIAEYVLYLWQMEDVVRAFGDDEAMRRNKFLSELQDMMRTEGVYAEGHTQIALVAQQEMEEWHERLLQEDARYRGAMLQILPSLTLLKARSDNPTQTDISMMLVFLYEVMMLRLQKKPISEPTLALQQQVSRQLAYLSAKYRNDDNSTTL